MDMRTFEDRQLDCFIRYLSKYSDTKFILEGVTDENFFGVLEGVKNGIRRGVSEYLGSLDGNAQTIYLVDPHHLSSHNELLEKAVLTELQKMQGLEYVNEYAHNVALEYVLFLINDSGQAFKKASAKDIIQVVG